MKIVIDTNIWISFLIGKVMSKMFDFIQTKKISILTSEEQMVELLDVLNRPKMKKYISESDIRRLFFIITQNTQKINIVLQPKLCRDFKDNFILDIALNSNADFIITGDKDLLILNPFNNTEILTYSEFEVRLANYTDNISN